MSTLEIKFCPNCDNILNISKNPPKARQNFLVQNLETPDTVTDNGDIKADLNSDNESLNSEISEDKNDDIENEISNDQEKMDVIINKIISSGVINDPNMNDLKLEQFLKNKTYQKLDKKTKSSVSSKLISYYEKIDDTTSAYYYCGICSYAKPIESGTLVASRMCSGFTNSYMNTDRLKNKVNDKMLPFTRNYICINNKCESHINHNKREAVIYRIGGSIQAWYTCCECKSHWKGE